MSLRFCNNCDNLLVIKYVDGAVFHKCHCCQHEDTDSLNTSVCISRNSFQKQGASYSAFLNEHALSDPTLPCVDTIECTSGNCTKKQEEANKVVYIKYDHVNLAYIYYCKHCKHVWRTN